MCGAAAVWFLWDRGHPITPGLAPVIWLTHFCLSCVHQVTPTLLLHLCMPCMADTFRNTPKPAPECDSSNLMEQHEKWQLCEKGGLREDLGCGVFGLWCSIILSKQCKLGESNIYPHQAPSWLLLLLCSLLLINILPGSRVNKAEVSEVVYSEQSAAVNSRVNLAQSSFSFNQPTAALPSKGGRSEFGGHTHNRDHHPATMGVAGVKMWMRLNCWL